MPIHNAHCLLSNLTIKKRVGRKILIAHPGPISTVKRLSCMIFYSSSYRIQLFVSFCTKVVHETRSTHPYTVTSFTKENKD